jgi:Uma2 family endonuclease
MAVLIRDPELEERLRCDRQAKGLDRWDEVWEGVYVMPPYPNDEHQFLQSRLNTILDLVIGLKGAGEVRAGVNVSDRMEDWTKNYRCPDLAVFMTGTKAQNCGTFWLGGPDFTIEIVSPEDSSRDKLEFYANAGVRELLLIDRAPWSLELYRLVNGRLVQAAVSLPTTPDVIRSEVVPLSFRLLPGNPRPTIQVTHVDGSQEWMI